MACEAKSISLPSEIVRTAEPRLAAAARMSDCARPRAPVERRRSWHGGDTAVARRWHGGGTAAAQRSHGGRRAATRRSRGGHAAVAVAVARGGGGGGGGGLASSFGVSPRSSPRRTTTPGIGAAEARASASICAHASAMKVPVWERRKRVGGAPSQERARRRATSTSPATTAVRGGLRRRSRRRLD